jgi:hypothetical protein
MHKSHATLGVELLPSLDRTARPLGACNEDGALTASR